MLFIEFTNHIKNMGRIINPKVIYPSRLFKVVFISIFGLFGYASIANAQDAGALQRQLQQQIERSTTQSQERIEKPVDKKAVSYTHLTLPTICSV